jgi:hypothetical protein
VYTPKPPSDQNSAPRKFAYINIIWKIEATKVQLSAAVGGKQEKAVDGEVKSEAF